MKEITLNLETIKVPRESSYSIEDMERMFGRRIRKAINSEPNKNNRIYKAVIAKKMARICKRWKFWNSDIRKTYKNYVGVIIVPWVIVSDPPEIMCSPETLELLKLNVDAGKYGIINTTINYPNKKIKQHD